MTAAAALPPPSGMVMRSSFPGIPQISTRWLPALTAVTELRKTDALPDFAVKVRAFALSVSVPFLLCLISGNP
jgi:hypothetical protein